MKQLIKRVPLWLIFLIASCAGAVGAIAAFSTGHITETVMCLVMTILMAFCAGVELLATRVKKLLEVITNE